MTSHDGAELIKHNRRDAKRYWGSSIGRRAHSVLEMYSKEFGFLIARGDLVFLESRWYVTHSALMRLARRHRCNAIHVELVTEFCDPTHSRFTFKAVVYKSQRCRGFVGYGDADPSSVSPLVRGAEMRVAETRAVNRALRKAYGIGICSVEEIGSFDRSRGPERPIRKMPPASTNGNNGQGSNGNGTRVRDRLCQIIRRHKLDAELVKFYAVDFCGTKTLRDASREQVERFVTHLADWAAKDRSALLWQLNSYAREKAGAA